MILPSEQYRSGPTTAKFALRRLLFRLRSLTSIKLHELSMTIRDRSSNRHVVLWILFLSLPSRAQSADSIPPGQLCSGASIDEDNDGYSASKDLAVSLEHNDVVAGIDA